MTRFFVTAVFAVVTFAPQSFAQAPDKIRGKTATEWIDTLRTHKEAKYRSAALVVLGVYGPRVDGVLPAVTAALEADADPQVRREAAMLLGRFGDDAKGSVYVLGDSLRKDPSELVREAAAQALGGKLNPHAIEHVRILAEALNDPHAGTRAAAAEAILKLGDKASAALPALMTLAQDKKADRFSRQYAIKCVSRLGADNRDVAVILIAALHDTTAPLTIREEAADGLGRSTVAADKVLPPLAEKLEDPSVEVRRAVAAALTRQGKDAAIVWPAIDTGLKNPDQAVRYQLIRLTGRLVKVRSEAIPALIERAQKDANIENRIAAIQELGELPAAPGSEAAKALTILSQDDTSSAIRTAAEAALKKAGEM